MVDGVDAGDALADGRCVEHATVDDGRDRESEDVGFHGRFLKECFGHSKRAHETGVVKWK